VLCTLFDHQLNSSILFLTLQFNWKSTWYIKDLLIGEYHISEYQIWNYMKNANYAKLWDVFQIIFTLSHDQAALERGFSINNKLMVENMKEESLTAIRFVYDTVKSSAVHFSEIRLTPRLKRNVRAARMTYQLHLEDQKKLTAESEKARKRKAVQDKIRSVESKRKLLKESIAFMSQEANASAVQAEKKLFYYPG